MSAAGRPVPAPDGYGGRVVQHADGTLVGVREVSRSGGPVIDIRYPDGETEKVVPGGGSADRAASTGTSSSTGGHTPAEHGPAPVGEAALAVLRLGLDDWVCLGDLGAVVGPVEPAAERRRRVAALLHGLVGAGLVRAGELSADGFVAFPLAPVPAVAALLCRFEGPAPVWPLSGWLESTADGDALARAWPPVARS
jgi:hypothetical protein